MSFFTVNGVGKRFGGLQAVSGVSFEIAEGEIVGLIGPNGAGKTTLFNLCAGTFPPNEGAIEFRGERIEGLPAYEVCRRGIARTFQVVRPFPDMTCAENVTIGLIGGGRRFATASARAKEAERLLDFTGLGAHVRTEARNLNLINKKRLEMARALATSPRLIMLDEVLGGLNSGEMAEALKLIRAIRDTLGMTVLWIEHVMHALMSVVERVLVLHQGRLICQGPPDAVVCDAGVIEAYLGESDDD